MRARRLLLVLLVPALAALGLVGAGLAQQAETTVVGDLLSRALSTPTSRIAIGAVDGALSSDATIRDVTVSDRDGPWLRLDRARLVWRRTALLARRLEVDRLEIGRLEVLRRPRAAPGATETADGPLLPELPVRVSVGAFRLAELHLGASVLGAEARLQASGGARLGPPAEGLDLAFAARRLDAPGRTELRLTFVPQEQRLAVALVHDEPAGGLLARVVGLPGLPPVRLDLDGQGLLDDWRATLAFAAGEGVGGRGGARLVRAGDARRLELDLAARVAGLVPEGIAPAFAGDARLEGAVRFADSGAIRIERLDLASRTARIEAGGTLSADGAVDLALAARALPEAAQGASGIDALTFEGSVKGALTAPRVSGRLAAAGARMPRGRLARLEADLLLAPRAAESGRFDLSADARAEGLALADPALARAVGDRAVLALRGLVGTDGVADVETLRLTGPTLTANYTGRLGARALAGLATVELGDLGHFSDLAGRPLAGAVAVRARLDGDPGRDAVAVDLDATGRGVALGRDGLARMVGPTPSLRGRLSTVPGGYAFEGLRLEAAALAGALEGHATETHANVAADLRLPDLSRLDPALAGRASLEARLTGSLARPDLAVLVAAPSASALGRPVRDLRLEATARDLADRLDGSLRLAGSVGGRPLTGEAHLVRPDPARWTLERLALSLGRTAIAGRADLETGSGLAEGELRVAAPDLDDLSPLALTPLAGDLDGSVTLTREGGRQGARLVARARALRAGAFALADLDADLAGTDLTRRPVLDGRLGAREVVAGGETFGAVRLSARALPDVSDLALTARARGFDLDAAGRLGAEPLRLDLARLGASRGADRLALAGPAAVTIEGGAARIEGLAVAVGAGRVTLAGWIGPTLDLRLGATAVPLSATRILAPGLALAGTLDGEATLAGPAARPEGRYRLALTGLVAPQTRAAGLPPLDARASGTIDDGRVRIEGSLAAGRGLALTVAGTVPLAAEAPLDLAARGTLDAALADRALAAGGQRATGRIALDAHLSGTRAAPRVEGAATVSGGTFTDPLRGVRLTGIEGRLSGRGDTVVVERLTAATRNGGRVAVTGRVAVAPEAGFPGALRITADRAELVANPTVTAVANLALALDGPLARTPRIAGRVEVVAMDVTVPDRLPATVKPLPGVRHVGLPPGDPRARGGSRPGRPGTARRAPPVPFDATLDLAVVAPGGVFVRGRGIDAELGGEIRLTGSSRAPIARGEFALRRGRLTIIGQRIVFTRGRVGFVGELTVPDLDFLAETRAGDVTARVAISGPADRPEFELTSEPALPQDEVLSRLLFQRASGSLSPFQALQLAQAVAQFSGGGGGPEVFEGARRGLGLDGLDIAGGGRGGVLGDRLSVGVRTGARPEESAATLDLDLGERFKVQGEVSADGRTSLGVGAEWEY